MIDRDWLIAGIEIPIVEYELIMHNPSIKEILSFGEQNFFIGVQFLSLTKEDVTISNNVDLSSLSDFKILTEILQNDNELDNKNNVVKETLELLFPMSKVFITPFSIVIQEEEHIVTIDESNFNILQGVIKSLFSLNLGANSENPEFHPANQKAAEIAAQLMKARQQRALVKGLNLDQATGVLAKIVSILSVGVPMDYNNILNLTMFQFFDLFQRMLLKVEWDLYIKQAMFSSKAKQPDNWLEKDLYN